MKIHYSASSYASHLRQAKAYRALIGRAYPLVNDFVSADVVILHHEARDFATLYANYPALRRKYVVAYCVWEADELPEAYQASISHVQEVWTCSRYSKAAFDKHHSNVRYVPHVVERDGAFAPSDAERMKHLLGYDPKQTYFLAIALQSSPRKNLGALVRAFRAVRASMPEARLVLRTGPGLDPAFGADPGLSTCRMPCAGRKSTRFTASQPLT